MTEKGVIGFLSVQSGEVKTESEIAKNWDLALITASWEQRTATSLAFLGSIESKIRIIHFESTDPTIKKKKEEFIATCLGSLKLCEEVAFPPSNASEKVFRSLTKIFEEEFTRVGRPMRVLVDISSMPKKYLLFILGMGFKREYVASLSFLYAEASYVAPPAGSAPPANPAGFISDGEWTSVQIPFLEADDYVPNKRDVVVGLGAEIGVAIPTIERLEPRQLTLLRVKDPSGLVPKDLVEKEQRYVDTLLSQPGAQLREHELDSVLAVANDILKSCTGTTTCLAIGSKPHALSMGLAALADERIDVVCRTPNSYKAADAVPTGRLFRFVIEDRFEPSTYLKDSIDA